MADLEKARSTATHTTAAKRAPGRDDKEEDPPQGLAWIASLATVALLAAGLFLERGEYAPLRATGVVLLGLAAGFILAPFFLLSKYGKGEEREAYMQARVVVDRGLYGIVRHPQYLGYMLLACGFALLWQRWPAVLLALAGVASWYLQAVREERYCLGRFGAPYEQYLCRVPRFNVVLGIVRFLRRRGK